MSTLKQRFAELLLEKPEISQAEIARATGAKPPSVSAWFSGDTKTMKLVTATKAASLYGVNALWLATGDGPKKQAIQNQLAIPFEKSNVSEIEKRAKVPLISLIQAGELTDVCDLLISVESAQWIEPIYTHPSEQSYALMVEGDSMVNPIPGALSFPEGTILIVDPNSSCGPNDFVIAKDVSTQKATFKKLMTDGVRWYLKPLNPAYPTVEIDDPALRVIGKAIEFQPPGGKL